MPNRLLRLAFLAMPLVAMAAAFVTACGDDDAAPGPPDASTDGRTDGTTNVPDGGGGGTDSSTDAPPGDGGVDAPGDADAALPALCVTYSNADVVGDAGASEGTRPRYELIALRALHSGAKNADNSCEISQLFTAAFDPPIQFECLGFQLAALAGCTNAGQPLDYKIAVDENGDKCVVDGGAGNIQLGFRDPPGTYTGNDVGFLADLIKQAAITTGMSAADAERLKQLYLSQRASVLGPDAGTGDAGFSNSTCP